MSSDWFKESGYGPHLDWLANYLHVSYPGELGYLENKPFKPHLHSSYFMNR